MDKKLFIIIQARTTSTRLPKKVLKPLCKMSVLEVIFKRLSIFHDNIIIATTDDNTQMPIVDICKKHNIKYYEGSVDNVLQRYYKSAKYFGAKSGDTIVRITSDCPFIQPQIVKNAIELYYKNSLDYVWVDVTSSHPRGFDTEVFSFDRLEHTYKNAVDKYDKEHVSPYFKSNKNLKMQSINTKINHSNYRLTLDTEDDYKIITKVYKKLNCNLEAGYHEIIKALESLL